MASALRKVKENKKPIAYNRPTLSKKELVSVLNCLVEDQINEGRTVGQFERECARTIGHTYALAVSSPVAAYHLSFLGLGIGEGDEIICSTLTSLAVWDAAQMVGATIVPVDTSKESFHPTVEQIAQKITEKTKAVVVEHIYGSYFPELNELLTITKNNENEKIHVIEDISSHVGVEIDDVAAGSLSKINIINLNDDKLITAGRGAIVATSDAKIVGKLNTWRNPAKRQKGEINFDYNISNLQAALGMEQLGHLGVLLERRAKLGEFLYGLVAKSKFNTYFKDRKNDRYLDFPIVTDLEIGRIERHFRSQQIEIRRIVDAPIHHQLEGVGRLDFPNAEKLWLRSVRIPFYPHLSKSDLERLDFALRSLY